MNRLIVSTLAALDAAVQLAIALALVAAPLVLLFVVDGFAGQHAAWEALWPASAAVWQLGHLVPLQLTLSPELIAQAALPPEGASFTLSLAPLGFLVLTLAAGLRSGARALHAGAPVAGLVSGGATAGVASFAVALTSGTDAAAAPLWLRAALPPAGYLAALAVGASWAAWRAGGLWPIDALHDRVDAIQPRWRAAVAAGGLGLAVAVMGLVGLGGVGLATAIFANAGTVLSLSQAAGTDLAGAVLFALAQLAYLPTLMVWALAWIAGPGFSLGAGTAVSPAGTQPGVLPGIPVLGAVPEISGGVWMLCVLLVVAVGALAGWFARSSFARDAVAEAAARRAGALETEPFAPRAATTAVIAVGGGLAAALAALLASGSIGPGGFAAVGPAPLVVGLAVALELGIGAGILLLAPRGLLDEGEHAERT